MFRVFADKSGETWSVASAGIRAKSLEYTSYPVHSQLKARGIEFKNHHSQPVTSDILSHYHWVVTMEPIHCEAILKLDPTHIDRCFVLRNLAHPDAAVPLPMPDPTFEANQPVEKFDELFDILDADIPLVFRTLQQRVSDLEFTPE